MAVFLMTPHKKTTIFTEAKESSLVLALKRIIEGIMKRPPEESCCSRTTSSLMRKLWGNVASLVR
jgi:transcription elongation factor B subunit 2